MKKPRIEKVVHTEITDHFPEVANRAASAARLRLGNNKEHLVQEVVNSTLLQLWLEHKAGKTPQMPEHWAWTVARRQANRLAKVEDRYARGLLEEVEQDEQDEGYLPMPASTATPLDNAELSERFAALTTLLKTVASVATTQLDENEKTLFGLLYKQGQEMEQVAATLGLSCATVRKQWSRLLFKLLKCVRERLQEDPVCSDLLSTILRDERTFHDSILGLLRLVLKKGMKELEKFVHSAFSN